MLKNEEIFGLYHINELQRLPEILHALKIDPNIEFFMDASNVWFYGHKKGKLYVFDGETGKLDSLGPVESALDNLLDEWEH